MSKKTPFIAIWLLGGAACGYAVTEMSTHELTNTELEAKGEKPVVVVPSVPVVQVDGGTGLPPAASIQPGNALDRYWGPLLPEDVLACGHSCGSNHCEHTEYCCVGTGECIPKIYPQACPGAGGHP